MVVLAAAPATRLVAAMDAPVLSPMMQQLLLSLPALALLSLLPN